ncbi:MAG: molybdopterin-dependent oxidoreductase [Alphaproteobacteria bacterium]
MTAFTLNGRAVSLDGNPGRRLAAALRDDLGLTGTKIGCDAGDCGACTVLIDGRQACACLVPVGQVEGAAVETVEGLARDGLTALQAAFHAHGAAQCGICTPGMLMAATDLLRRDPRPGRAAVEDTLGGVLCRCTGYEKIVDAVLAASGGMGHNAVAPAPGCAVGARLPRIDGHDKLTGTELFGADAAPADSLHLRILRSPHAHARFVLGDLAPLHARWPGLVRVLTAADVPGRNGFGIIPGLMDQPVFADGVARYRGDAVLALVGDADTIARLPDSEVPIAWEVLADVRDMPSALRPGAPQLHADKAENTLIRGRVVRGDAEGAVAGAAAVAEGAWTTSFVEHAYIEPEAGYARRTGDRIEIVGCTQAPYMDRETVAAVLGIAEDRVRVIPTGCGGGFGGKLDVAVQPALAVAAWLLDRPVRTVFTRPDSMRATTKRHPAAIRARMAADAEGRLVALDFHADFETGAYSSWGPTVAGRVPVHATGPYAVANVRATSRAVFTHHPPSGAFRGFGVPQAAIAHECLMDDLAEKLGIDPLEFRVRNALRKGSVTATGQVMEHSVGLVQCLEALRPRWVEWRAAAEARNRAERGLRLGVGVGCMWYGCGNTAMSNPSRMRVAIDAAGLVTLYNGAVDIGQGTYTILPQIVADAIGIPVASIRQITGDTDRTHDAGKTSASRQTFVSGRAAQAAGEALRAEILRHANAGPDARIEIDGATIRVTDGSAVRGIDLHALPAAADGSVLAGEGTFDPPTTRLDADGQGSPYATYGFAAQMAEVAVDPDLGTVRVRRMVAAHDVGRAVNPTLIEGQIAGGIAQGLGLALMEEYLPGRTENLHDYLIPTFGDMPALETILIEDPEPLGPYGAKGIGEPALVPTAPAILGAIRHATGLVVRHVPALPHRVRAGLRALEEARK